jgi:integrase
LYVEQLAVQFGPLHLDRAWFYLLVHAGLQASEVCNLRVGDVDLDVGVAQWTQTLHLSLCQQLLPDAAQGVQSGVGMVTLAMGASFVHSQAVVALE